MSTVMERLWAGWRSDYVGGSSGEGESGCVFCRLLASDLPEKETNIVRRTDKAAAILNAYPYSTGHLLLMPVRHLGELEELDTEEGLALWQMTQEAVVAIKAAYKPDGANIGANLGSAAGAGIPGHLHLHALPRWSADTNFMTAVANTRVLPESLDTTWHRLSGAWPA